METRKVQTERWGEVTVIRTSLEWATTYAAYVPSSYFGCHSALYSTEAGVLGDVTSEMLPADLDALPSYSKERLDAVRAWRGELLDAAGAAIREAFPEASGCLQL
jgi:hypothetical protein